MINQAIEYRACVYDRKNPAFWKYTKLYKTKSEAFNAGHKLAYKNKVELADILITDITTTKRGVRGDILN